MNGSNPNSAIGLTTQEVLLQILIPGNTLTGQWANTGLSMGSQMTVSSSLSPTSYWVWERYIGPQEVSWSLKPDKDSNLYMGVDANGNLVMKPASDRAYITLDAGIGGGFVFRIAGTKQEYIGMTGDGDLIVTREFSEWDVVLEKELDPAQTGRRYDILIVKESISSRKWIVNSPMRGDEIMLDIDHQDSKGSHWLSDYDSTFTARLFRPILKRTLFITTDAKNDTVTLQPADAASESARHFRGSGFGSLTMSGAEGNYLTVNAETSTLSLSKEARLASSWSFQVYGYELGGQIYPGGRSVAVSRPEGEKPNKGRECIDTTQKSNCCDEK